MVLVLLAAILIRFVGPDLISDVDRQFALRQARIEMELFELSYRSLNRNGSEAPTADAQQQAKTDEQVQALNKQGARVEKTRAWLSKLNEKQRVNR